MRINEEYSKDGRLEFFQDLYQSARAKSEGFYAELEQHYDQYKGSPIIDGSAEEASVVRNITYELIESQISGYIPTAKVTAEVIGDEGVRLSRSVERLLSHLRDKLPFEEMNDLDERYSYIYGGSVWLVEWDNSIVTHDTVGGVKVSCMPPEKFTGQPGIYNIDDMEYCFIEFETTKDDIVRKYGVTYERADETVSEDYEEEDIATVYVCFYRNDDGKVCQYIWSGDVELADIDDYYARKLSYCTVCGEREELCRCEDSDSEKVRVKSEEEDGAEDEEDTSSVADDEKRTALDAGPYRKGRVRFEVRCEEYEELESDVLLSNGKIIPATSLVFDEQGKPVFEEASVGMRDASGNPVLENVGGVMMPSVTKERRLKTRATRLPFYAPDVFPIVIRKNTSKKDSLFGQSDCEFIRPQQQAINKVETRIVQKLMRSGVIPLVPDDHEGDLTNQILEMAVKVVKGGKSDYGTWDLTPDISKDIAEAERLYEHAKRILGISASFQGQHDASAQSGKAKELQIQQAAGRLDSKKKMKHAAYARMDEIIFKYYLSYADEPRPVPYKDSFGRMQGLKFNRYDYLKCDECGEWYWDDAYTFATDASLDIERLRDALWEQILGNLKNGAYGDPASPQTMMVYWLNLERAGYPFAHENVEYFRDIAAQLQMQTAPTEAMPGAAGAAATAEAHSGNVENTKGGLMR